MLLRRALPSAFNRGRGCWEYPADAAWMRNDGSFASSENGCIHLAGTTTIRQISRYWTVPATLSDFKIDPPSLLTMPVKNEIPVRVEMTWHSQ
jgi:hypothetical protein